MAESGHASIQVRCLLRARGRHRRTTRQRSTRLSLLVAPAFKIPLRPKADISEYYRPVRFRLSQSAGRGVPRRALIKKPDFERGKNGNDDANDDMDKHRSSPRKTEHPGRNQDPDAQY